MSGATVPLSLLDFSGSRSASTVRTAPQSTSAADRRGACISSDAAVWAAAGEAKTRPMRQQAFNVSRMGPKPGASLVRRLRRFAAAQLLDEQRQAVGKTVDVETPGIVMAVADVGVDGGVECRHQPASGADAGDGVKQCEAVVLRGGEARARRLRIVMAAVSGRAAPRLNHLDMQEQPFQTADEIHRALEF